MAFTDGTVQCLGDLLLLHLTDEDGIGKTLLVSAADGSTQYPSLAVTDACRFETGLGILLEDGQVLLLPDSDGAQKLTLEEENRWWDSCRKSGASSPAGMTQQG